jgi:hypothetical protein
MKYLQKSTAIFIVLLTLLSNCFAATSFLASDIKFDKIFGAKTVDSAIYMYIGSSWMRPFTNGLHENFVTQWLETHPSAKATLISDQKIGSNSRRPSSQLVYVWIEDDQDCLNVALIRNGIFPGGVMIDSVEAEQQLIKMLLDPKLASARVQVEKELAARPKEDRPKRLVSDSEYKVRLMQIEKAESEARAKKLGIWSDDFKSEREALGVF